MLKKGFLLFLYSITFSVTAQVVNGIVYDAESTVKGVKVLNITQKTVTGTNEIGEFSLKAKVSDTLFFESLFHEPNYAIVSEDYFKSTFVFELKKVVNELDEVYLKDKPKVKQFEGDVYNENMNKIIELDKKKEPQKYNAAPKYGLDFIQVFRMIGKLFKKKKTPEPNTLDYKQLKLLFETNNFFTKKLLTTDLKVPENYHSLFYEFCETKAIKENILDYTKRLELLNLFTLYSQEFLMVIEMSQVQQKN